MIAALLLTLTAQAGTPTREMPAPQALPTSPSMSGAQDQFTDAASRKEAEQMMRELGECLAARGDKAKVAAFLRTDPTSPAAREQGIALTNKTCQPRTFVKYRMHLRPMLLRSSLYDAMYRREFAKPVELANRAPIDFTSELDLNGAAAPTDYVYLRQLGDCTARQDPADVRAMVLADNGSAAEKAALTGAMPALQNCLPSGELRFSRTMLRGLLGEAMYKLSKAPMASPVAGGAK